MLLKLITDAPTFVVREALAFVPHVSIDDTVWDGTDAPAWASTIIVAPQSDALALGLSNLGSFRFERFVPRPMYADPTYAIAAANIDRSRGGSAAPAAMIAR